MRKEFLQKHTLFVIVWSFFSLWASSQIRRSQASLWQNFDECILNVSYETINTWKPLIKLIKKFRKECTTKLRSAKITCNKLRGLVKLSIPETTSSLLLSQRAISWTLCPTHFLISASQLLTRLVGVTIMAFLTIGFPSNPWRRRVYSKVIDCNVFPKLAISKDM